MIPLLKWEAGCMLCLRTRLTRAMGFIYLYIRQDNKTGVPIRTRPGSRSGRMEGIWLNAEKVTT